MSEAPLTAEDELTQEREETIRWYAVTHCPEYDQTIQRDVNGIVDQFVEAQQKADMLKGLVKGMDSDYDRLNFARGVVWLATRVLGWKHRSAAGHEEMMAQDEEERAGDDMPDVGPGYEESWPENRP